MCCKEGAGNDTTLPLQTCTSTDAVVSTGALHTMAVCHHIGMVKGEMLGDPLEIVSLAFAGGKQTSVPIGAAGSTVFRDAISLNGSLRFIVLTRFQFQAELQRMVRGGCYFFDYFCSLLTFLSGFLSSAWWHGMLCRAKFILLSKGPVKCCRRDVLDSPVVCAAWVVVLF